MSDVIVIGGGVIGLSTAYELSKRDLRVTVLDKGEPGREASWAGAGILPPGRPGDPEHPLARLCSATHSLWHVLTDELRQTTGIDNGYRRSGGLEFSPDGHASSLREEIEQWQRAGVSLQPLTAAELAELEPHMRGCPEQGSDPLTLVDASRWRPNVKGDPCSGQHMASAYRLPDLCQVRNPRHLKALQAACLTRGVSIRCGQPIVRIERQGERVIAVHSPTERFIAGVVIVTAGAWTREVLAGVGLCVPIEPVRGQIVLLEAHPLPFRHVLSCGPRYLVPRPDGRILVGSTEEWVGFDRRNTAAGLRGLLDFAARMVPTLSEARFERSWAGLRPHSTRGLPLIGRVPQAENLYVAAGHFREGLNLSPITARLMAQLVCGETPDVPLDAFDPGRVSDA